MAPKLRAAEPHADTPDDREEDSSRLSTRDSSTPSDALSLVQEQMAFITARLDAQATQTAALRHRDALCDTHMV
jgi:hypothetical protein